MKQTHTTHTETQADLFIYSYMIYKITSIHSALTARLTGGQMKEMIKTMAYDHKHSHTPHTHKHTHPYKTHTYINIYI